MVTQVHSTHIFELAKEIQAERIHEARVAHLVAQQKRKWPVSLSDVLAWLASHAVRRPVRLRTRPQSLA